ncbi:hypothetical protein ZWY2020_010787 [Hordeum vulgare]|nr:hypothetical protein ZWY2020_010787 [Hordeum vulgare]
MIGTPVPEPDTSTDIVEPARYNLPVTRWDRSRHVFVGFTQRNAVQDAATVQEITPVNSDSDSSMGETDSIHPLQEGQLGGLSLAMDPEVLERSQRQIATYMARLAQPQQNPTGNKETGGTSKPPAQTMAELAAEVATLMATTITSENQESINPELAKLREAMAKAQWDMEAEAARVETQQAAIAAETERLNTQGWWLERQQHASDAVHQRRHHGRVPAELHPTRLFDTPRTPGAGPNRPLENVPRGGPVPPPNPPPPHPMDAYVTRFQTPRGHFSNPRDNVLAATRILESRLIYENSPTEIEARNTIKMLKTTVVQHAQYSHSLDRVHSTPQASHTRSCHEDLPAVTSGPR